MIITENENKFSEKINQLYYKWIDQYNIDLHLISDEYEILEFSELLFRDFLHLDEFLVEDLYRQKTSSELISFFVDNFNKNAVIDFILFIIHFIIEENVNLFISSFECNGRYFGHWATAKFRDDEISRIINERILQLHTIHDYSDYYKKKYIESTKETEQSITGAEGVVENVPTLLKILVGASGATLIFGSLLRFSIEKVRLWKNTDSVAQVMFTIGCTPGSINLYGFCLEKTKPSPTIKSKYEPIKKSELNEEVSSSLSRTVLFIDYLKDFLTVDDQLIFNIAMTNPYLIWYHFQLFFWLITQPFSHFRNENDWILFLMAKRTELENIQGLNVGLESEYTKDSYLVALTRVSCEILNRKKNIIHPANLIIFEDILNNCFEED